MEVNVRKLNYQFKGELLLYDDLWERPQKEWRHRRGSRNSQVKGPYSDNTLESHSIDTEEANLSGTRDRGALFFCALLSHFYL
jgi:hypothetical protein